MDSTVVSNTVSGFMLSEERIYMITRIALILVIGLPLVFSLVRLTRRVTRNRFTAQQTMLFEKLVRYSGLIILTISVLRELGFHMGSLLGAAGIFGIAIGFASQTSVSNIISGLFLIGEKPFEINDIITVGSTTGVVLSVDLLSVKMRTFDNKYIRIPNETLIKTEVTNITRFPIRRLDMNIGVAYKEDIGRVREVLMDIARQNPYCLNEPEPLIIMAGFGNSSLDMIFGLWVLKSDFLTLKNSIFEEIKARFDAEGIEIPFPHISFYTGSVTEPLPIKMVPPEEGDA